MAVAPALGPPAAPPAVDFALGLQQGLGREALYRQLLKVYLDQHAEDGRKMRAAWDAGDLAALSSNRLLTPLRHQHLFLQLLRHLRLLQQSRLQLQHLPLSLLELTDAGLDLADLDVDLTTRGHLDRGLDHLTDEFAGTFSRKTVERYMAESLEGLSGARMQNFVPLLGPAKIPLVASDTDSVKRGAIADKYAVLVDAMYGGRAEQFIETAVKFEDGRTGSVSATLKITDAKTYPAMNKAA